MLGHARRAGSMRQHAHRVDAAVEAYTAPDHPLSFNAACHAFHVAHSTFDRALKRHRNGEAAAPRGPGRPLSLAPDVEAGLAQSLATAALCNQPFLQGAAHGARFQSDLVIQWYAHVLGLFRGCGQQRRNAWLAKSRRWLGRLPGSLRPSPGSRASSSATRTSLTWRPHTRWLRIDSAPSLGMWPLTGSSCCLTRA
jgi:hypothetical protein